MKKEIIDFHTHIGSQRAGTYEESGERQMMEYGKTTDGLVGYMTEYGIDKAVVFALPMLPHKQAEANDEVMGLVSGKSELIPFAFLDPRLHESPDLLQRYVVDRGCRGLKLHPVCHGYVVSNSLSYPTFEVADYLKIPVLIHTGWGEYGEIRFLKKLAEDFRDLKIVVGHLIEFKDVFTILPTFENVFVETSYSTHPRRIAQAVNIMGADRVVFGSDMPLTTPGFELYKVGHAPVSDLDKEKILFKNAQRLLER